jgi:hypothetical protein
VINTIAIVALPKGNILYEVWFRRKLPTNFLNYKESTSYKVKSNKNSSSNSREDSLFINEEAE